MHKKYYPNLYSDEEHNIKEGNIDEDNGRFKSTLESWLTHVWIDNGVVDVISTQRWYRVELWFDHRIYNGRRSIGAEIESAPEVALIQSWIAT